MADILLRDDEEVSAPRVEVESWLRINDGCSFEIGKSLFRFLTCFFLSNAESKEFERRNKDLLLPLFFFLLFSSWLIISKASRISFELQQDIIGRGSKSSLNSLLWYFSTSLKAFWA